jgi:hypothetical protein
MPFRTPPPSLNKSRIADLDHYVARAKQARKDLEMLEREFMTLQALMKHEGTLALLALGVIGIGIRKKARHCC